MQYDNLINENNGIDLQILGIGINGHIGFNEPSNKLLLDTHVTDLSKKTLEQNSKFFSDIYKMPKQAITMGLGTIMKARQILLLVTGKRKAEVIANCLRSNEINTDIPASALLLHNNLTILLDEDAACIYLKEKKMTENENVNNKYSNYKREFNTIQPSSTC
jgi:glucosamine-6-phosphate deaminase